MSTEIDNTKQLATTLLAMGVIRRLEDDVPKLLPDVKIRGMLMPPLDERPVDFDKPPTSRHSFDVSKPNVKIEEVAKAFVENTAVGDGVTSSEIKIVDGKPDILFSDYNRYAELERRATLRTCELLLRQGCGVTIWISPEDGYTELGSELAKKLDRGYPQGRLNITYTKVVDGEVKVFGKHIPLKDINRFVLLDLANRLITTGGKIIKPINKVDDLRESPIGFEIQDGSDWLGKCCELMPEFKQQWDLIEKGDDVVEQKRVEKDACEALKVARGDNVKFQIIMESRGHKITPGDHGGGYLDGGQSILSYTIQMIDGQFYTEPVHDKFGRLICPVCGAEISESSSVCPVCKINFLGEK